MLEEPHQDIAQNNEQEERDLFNFSELKDKHEFYYSLLIELLDLLSQEENLDSTSTEERRRSLIDRGSFILVGFLTDFPEEEDYRKPLMLLSNIKKLQNLCGYIVKEAERNKNQEV